MDGSQLAEVALAYAKELAGRSALDVLLLHVYGRDEHESAIMHRAYLDRAAEKVAQQSEKIRQQAGSDFGGKAHAVRSELAVGHPAEEILSSANENNIDLILMATHGRSGGSGWANGSITDRVRRRASHPVFLVRVIAKPRSLYHP